MRQEELMQAGFARVDITPPIGARMTGFADRDRAQGAVAIHDHLYARALYVAHGDQKALIMGFDLLFFSRDEADRFKGAIGRKVDLAPSQILLNTSHTHTGPKVGSWIYDPPSDPLYLQQLEDAIVRAACQARDAAVDVALWAGATRTGLPLNRRLRLPSGEIAFAPNPDGPVCDALPVCLFKALDGRPVCLLFSVSCHPSTIGGFEISAEYPGVAMAQLDAHLGRTSSLFLQGAGGDTKPRMVGQGRERWRAGSWDDVAAAGSMVAWEVIGALEAGLSPVEPDLCSRSIDMVWPLQRCMDPSGYEAVLADPRSDLNHRLWAEDKLAWLKRGLQLPTSVPITLHSITLGQGLRLVGLEGEPVAELGRLILRECGDGVTFPLGYTDGAQLYLPTSAMIDEGGYEVDSYSEYRQPAPLAKGMEDILTKALRAINTQTPGCHTG